jgi:hypothetical protein
MTQNKSKNNKKRRTEERLKNKKTKKISNYNFISKLLLLVGWPKPTRLVREVFKGAFEVVLISHRSLLFA